MSIFIRAEVSPEQLLHKVDELWTWRHWLEILILEMHFFPHISEETKPLRI
jgi:hypothetical protein